ncbi:MAG: VCBS repeat-containing protein [Flavobacteriales bacterium]|nr:VCBS repeat-containing protein [Flavobacteriales bacterium]
MQSLAYEPGAGKLDVDGDGLTDLVFGGRVLYSNGNGTFVPTGSIQPMGFQSIANVNCDDAPEAVLSSPVPEHLYAFPG